MNDCHGISKKGKLMPGKTILKYKPILEQNSLTFLVTHSYIEYFRVQCLDREHSFNNVSISYTSGFDYGSRIVKTRRREG